MQLSWVPLAQSLPQDCDQGIYQGYSHHRARWGMGLRPGSLTWLLSGLRRSPPCSLTWPLNWSASQHGSWLLPEQTVQERVRERAPGIEDTGFCNLISDMTSHHFCHFVFLRSKSVSPAHAQGEQITCGEKYWETRR